MSILSTYLRSDHEKSPVKQLFYVVRRLSLTAQKTASTKTTYRRLWLFRSLGSTMGTTTPQWLQQPAPTVSSWVVSLTFTHIDESASIGISRPPGVFPAAHGQLPRSQICQKRTLIKPLRPCSMDIPIALPSMPSNPPLNNWAMGQGLGATNHQN